MPNLRLLVSLAFMLIIIAATAHGQAEKGVAPGAPGLDAHWPGAAKNGFGTSNTLRSKVWFTLSDGIMTEAFYPGLDVPNTNALQFVVASEDGKRVETESEDTVHHVKHLGALVFRQINTARDGAYTITKSYVTDPERDTILIYVTFRARRDEDKFRLYVYYDPSLNNSGMHDTAWTEGGTLMASDGNISSALDKSGGFREATNGYLGTSDGMIELRKLGRLYNLYERATDGNVVQLARVGTESPFMLALGFGRTPAEARHNASASLYNKGFVRARLEYESGWSAYLSSLVRVAPEYRRQFNLCAMVLKALEDKTQRGAGVASPSIPWGGGPNGNEPTVTGYHAVWSRDLYHAATAFLAMGDRESAARTLDYLFLVQQRADGTFPQNSRIDGQAIGGSLQLDETAYPLILAYQLGRTDAATWKQHVKPAADALVRLGPRTEQERWEEERGYSPSTIAALVSGLVCASHIARQNHDEQAADKYLAVADDWASNVERWTVTTTGTHPERSYYLRVTENGDPNDGAQVEINSGGGSYDEREIVDAGFLELVRLGIKRADDSFILKSLAAVDRLIKVRTPHGAAWYRYNHDAYGERDDGGAYDGRSGRGRLWTLLTGERGEYELARGRINEARACLHTMMGFANEGGMIAEQVWDRKESPRPGLRFGAGTGSATPLAWSMAQFIRLAVNLQKKRNLETPAVVAARYLGKRVRGAANKRR